MKKPAFFLAALCAGSLLLGSCNSTTTDNATTTEATEAAADSAGTASVKDPAHADHAGHTGSAAAPGMMGLMHTMMQQMENFKPMGNTDHDFAHMMMAHHQGAVAMSALLLKEGKDATLRAMAEKISTDQQQEMQALEAIATRLDAAPTNYKPQDANDPFTAKMQASMDGMMKDMAPASGNVDQDYAALMIPHHQSAIDMAQAELTHGRDTKLKEMARQMIAAQQQEIQQFKAWQAKNGGKAKPAAAVYECPMGCEGSQGAKPGQCPKCGMDLVKKA
ncbi:Uncharacterized conserved protein, DUF305 family [Hymenobacter daecheongensis DSM 21074]|uniref:Uncharacterized conserved protein, DUF305 family n=1 Tax=Hymenobacter daecheongensis DSM 21074 TaxID=1121955 RepID=A0A1M6G3B8_9BACT|nr:DUF305 domain-containing protein [Hymenobacter daecheongensis]SHJ04446.1 Uncharacterized conserved protein, DUF305 family [Hymenobacter daecheongensis DSM 21074]